MAKTSVKLPDNFMKLVDITMRHKKLPQKIDGNKVKKAKLLNNSKTNMMKQTLLLIRSMQ